MSDITIEQAYEKMQAACGIEAGDEVKLLRACKPKELGYGFDPYNETGRMDEAVGKTGLVQDKGRNYLMVSIGEHVMNVPFFVLELAEKARLEIPNNVSFTADGLKVGEVFLSKDTIRRNLDL